jgi:hypothetical protein
MKLNSSIIIKLYMVFVAATLLACRVAIAQIVITGDNRSVATGDGASQVSTGMGGNFYGYLDTPDIRAGIQNSTQIAYQRSGLIADGLSLYGYADTDIMLLLPSSGENASSDLDLQFTVDNPANCVFTCNCSGGTGSDGVLFSGTGIHCNVSANGLASTIGVLSPGQTYRINAACASSSIYQSASWTFLLQLQNAPSRYNAQQIAILERFSLASGIGGLAEGGVAVVLVTIGTGGIADILAIAAVSLDALAVSTGILAHDPPDTNFTAIALPVFPNLQLLAPGLNVTQGEATSLNAWVTDLSQSLAYSQALYTSINRASGAAAATNAYWQTAQLNAVVQYESKLAGLLYQEPTLRSNVLVQLQAAGFPSITLYATNFTDLLGDIAMGNGLPSLLQQAASQLGLDGTTVSNIEDSFFGIDIGSVTGTFPANLANTNLDSAMLNAASTLWFSSPQFLNPMVLSGGNFRFDLSTLSNCTYTVQYNEDLKNPAGWTALLTTNATASFLSFTNMPPLGSKARFYRAYHN